MARIPVVAVLNSNDDVLEMLRILLEGAGFVVVSAHIDKIRRGEQSFVDFINEHSPQVLIYDLVPPYDRSWRFLEHLRGTPLMQHRKFIVTSTNAARAREIIGDDKQVFEIVGKPYDIDLIVEAVRRATGGGQDLPEGARRV